MTVMAAADLLAGRIRSIPFAALAGLSFVLIVPFAFALNIWQDEAYTLHTTAHGAAFAYTQSLRFEQNAPLYFVLIALWRHIGESVFFLRFFSVLCAAATIILVPGIVRRYVPRTDAGLVTVAIAWNPFFFWAALEMRAYAMIVLASALLLLTFYDAFLARKPAGYAPVLYALCAAVALYTQYYLAFLIAAQFIVLCVYRRSALPAYLLSAGAAVLAFVPLLATIPGQVQNFRSPFAPPATPLHAWGVLASMVAHYVLPLPLSHASFAYGIIAAAVIALAVIKPRWFTTAGDALIPLMTALAVLIFGAVTYVSGVVVLSRHGASLYVPAVLSVFALLTFVRADLRARATTAWFCITIAACAVLLVQTYAHLAKPGDWQRVTAALNQRESPGEPIAVFEAENALPFAFYYHGPNRVVAIPAAVNFDRYDVSAFVVRSAQQLARTMPRAKHLWLITAGECASADLQFGCEVVERYVAAHYRTQYDAAFYQSRLRLLAPL